MAELAEVGLDIRLYVNLDLGDIYKDSPAIVDLAYTHHPADTSIAHYSNVDSMLEHIPMVQSFYERCFNSDELHQPCESDCVWPGDADHNGIVNNLDALHIGDFKRYTESGGSIRQNRGLHLLQKNGIILVLKTLITNILITMVTG